MVHQTFGMNSDKFEWSSWVLFNITNDQLGATSLCHKINGIDSSISESTIFNILSKSEKTILLSCQALSPLPNQRTYRIVPSNSIASEKISKNLWANAYPQIQQVPLLQKCFSMVARKPQRLHYLPHRLPTDSPLSTKKVPMSSSKCGWRAHHLMMISKTSGNGQ